MRLEYVIIRNYRCHKETKIPIYDITVLIGPNDSGKSSVIKALDLFFDTSTGKFAKRPDVDDFYKDPNGKQEKEIELECKFVDDNENEVLLKKVFKLLDNEVSNPIWYRYVESYVNDEFRDIESALSKGRKKKDDLISIIVKYNMSPDFDENELKKMKIEKLTEIIRAFLEKQPREKKWIEIDKNDECIKELPRFELYDSNEYENPENYLKKIMSSHFVNVLKNENVKQIVDEFQGIVSSELSKKFNELSSFLKKSISSYLPNLRDVNIEPSVDPKKAFTGTIIKINDGRGEHEIIRKGEGIKKLLFVYITEWESTSEKKESIIRAYDEPDNSLHYSAQRTFFKAIYGQKNLQVILATHSIILADMVPFHKVILLKINEKGYAESEYLKPDEMEDIEEFMMDLGISLGISSWEFFFEKGIVLVEGATEKVFIQTAFKKIYNATIKEKGIVLIDIEGNGAVPQLLKLLKFKESKVFLLLDRDTKTRRWRGKKTLEEIIKESGYSGEFIDKHIIYIGEKEFEDAFDDDYLIKVISRDFGIKEQTIRRKIYEIRQNVRQNPNYKFSEALINSIQEIVRQPISKTELALKLAENIDIGSLPNAIKDLFEKIKAKIE